jgi:tetratricopeptide (TPR) repeat protein/O-antigen ligase
MAFVLAWLVIFLLTPVRLSLYPEIFLIAVFAALLSAAVFRHARLRFRGFPLSSGDAAVFAFLSVQLMELATSTYAANTWLYVMDVCLCTAVYVAARLEAPADRRMRTILRVLGCAGLLVALIDIGMFSAQYLRWRAYGFEDLTSFRESFLMFGGINQREATSLLLLLLGPVYFCRTAEAASGSWFARATAAFALAAVTLSLTLSLSRSAFLSTALFFAIASVCQVRAGLLSMRQAAATFATTGAFVFLFLTFGGLLRPAVNTALIFRTSSQTRSVAGRLRIWQDALRGIRRHPWTGVGGYNYPVSSLQPVGEIVVRPVVSRSFNWILQLAAETGIAGLLAFGAMAGVAFVRAWRTVFDVRRSRFDRNLAAVLGAQLAAILFHDLSDSTVTVNLSVTVLVWLTCGLMPVGTGRHKAGETRFPSQKPLMALLTLLLAVTSAAIAMAGWRTAEGVEACSRSLAALNAGECGKGTSLISEAIRFNPGSAANRAVAGLIEVRCAPGAERRSAPASGPELAAATNDYREAVGLRPEDALFWNSLGSLYSRTGRPREAASALEKAVSLDPGEALYRVSLGLWYEANRSLGPAVGQYAAALVLAPRILNSPFFMEFQRRHPAEASLSVRQAIDAVSVDAKSPGDPITSARLGALLLAVNRQREARPLLESAVATLPNLGYAWYNLGRIASDAGDRDRAALYYRRAVYLDSGNSLARLALADISAAANRREEALRLYLSVLGGRPISPHAYRWFRLYRLPVGSRLNDIVPESLLKDIGPAIETDRLCRAVRRLRVASNAKPLAGAADLCGSNGPVP